MPIACLLVPSLALAIELAERPALASLPVALADEAGVRVEDCTHEARQRGVRPGQTLREAAAYCPALTVLEQRPAHVQRTAEALVEALAVVSPLVEDAAPGEVYADLRGLERLYPAQESLTRAVFASIDIDLDVRLGVAGTRFTACVAAHRAAPGNSLCIEERDAAVFLAEQPVTALTMLDAEAQERLRLLGIETCGALAALPRHAVEAQFGVIGGLAWLAARGEDPTRLHPRPVAGERIIERSQAETPLVSRQAVLLTGEQLLNRALRRPALRNRFVRMLRLRVVTEDERLWERTQVLREPTGDRARLWTAVRAVIEYAEFPGVITELELELGGLTAESGRQRSLFDTERVRRHEQMNEMVRHLGMRYGHSPVARVVKVEPWSRIPERRWALMDYEP